MAYNIRHQKIGGISGELTMAFAPRVKVGTLMEIPSGCMSTWVPRYGQFHLKFRNRSCPCQICRKVR